MKRSLPNNHFDNLLRNRYDKHTIPPEKELWENINSRVNQKKLINYLRKIQRLKIAASILAFALIGTLIFCVSDVYKRNNPTTDLNEQENPIIDTNKPDIPVETIPEKPLNSVHKVILSDQEQDIPETDSYFNDDSVVVLSQ